MDPRALIEEGARGGFGQEDPYMAHNLPPEMLMADPVSYIMNALIDDCCNCNSIFT